MVENAVKLSVIFVFDIDELIPGLSRVLNLLFCGLTDLV
jgi:hypothetical protein